MVSPPVTDAPSEDSPRRYGMVTVMLTMMNIAGIFLAYASSILLARHLSHNQFEQYVGAVATLGLMSSLAEAGFGKYALRIIPSFVATGRTREVRGYVRFAILGTLLMSLVVSFVASLLEIGVRSGEEETVILVSIALLPTIAITAVVVDLLLAFRMPTFGTFISRVLIPLSTLGLVAWGIRHSTMTVYDAIMFYAAGSWIALIASTFACLVHRSRITSSSLDEHRTIIRWREWTTEGFSFMAFYFLIAWLSRATLYLVSHLKHDSDQLAILAAAMETGCLIVLISKSTDKYFLPNMAMFLDTTQWNQISRMRRTRFAFVSMGVAFFMIVIVSFGKNLLSLFGTDFVAGYGSLCLIAIGSSFWTLFSLAPSILLYADQQRLLLRLLGGFGIALMILTIVLYSRFGAIGAAAAYAMTITSFSMTSAFFARRILRIMSRQETSD